MRFLLGLLVMLSLTATSSLYAQNSVLDTPLNLSYKDIPLSQVFRDIEQQAAVTFSYDTKVLPNTNTVEGNFEATPLREVLDKLLKPEDLAWELKGNIIVVTLAATNVIRRRGYDLSGTVVDAETGERLIGAKVFDAISGEGTLSDETGSFTMRLPADSVKLIVTMLGYTIYGERLKLSCDLQRKVVMTGDLALETITITEEARPTDLEEAGASVIHVSLADLAKLPAMMGESDVLNLLKMFPGVHSGGDGSTGFYVRGGGPDQNLVLLDGATVYNASHLFGFYSVFNSEAIKDVRLVKGGFPARYGGRLSSVVDIQTKEGDLEKWGGDVNIGLISAKMMLSGPIVKGKTSMMVSARRTVMEPYFAVINEFSIPQNGNRLGYRFFDLQAKLQQIIGKRDKLLLSGYVGGDKFSSGYDISTGTDSNIVRDKFDFGLRWGNQVGSLQWRHQWSRRLMSNLSALGSQYSYKAQSTSVLDFQNQSSTKNALTTTSFVRDYGLHWAWDLLPDAHQWFRFGVAGTYHQFEPETFRQIITELPTDSTQNFLSQKRIPSLESMAWIEDQFHLGKRLSFNLGLHFSNYLVDSSWFWSLQPRGSVRLKLPGNMGLYGSYTDMAQYIHLLSNSGVGLPTDLWVPATSAVPPQRSRQYSMGWDLKLKQSGYLLSIEGYWKEMTGLIDYQTGVNFMGNTDWQDLVAKGGKGLSRGLEFLFRKTTGKLTGWVGYTLSRTDRQFADINFGQAYPYKYDRRHDLSTALILKLNDHIEASANWLYATGNAITFPEAVYYAPSSPLLGFWDLNQGQDLDVIIDYGNRNNFRLPTYHRLDINFRIYKNVKWGQTFWNFGVFNVYNRRNPYFLFLRADYSTDANSPAIKVRKMSLLPILPEVNFGFKF